MHKYPLNPSLVLACLITAAVPSGLHASSITWDGNGDSNSSGTWSTAVDWSTDAVPVTADSVTLGDVTSGTRTVTFSSSDVTLSSLILTQTTAGTTASSLANILSLTYGTTLTVTDSLVLGTTATNSTVGITITGPTSSGTVAALAANGGLTINTGGVLNLVFNGNNNFHALSGSLTLSGGVISVAAPTSGGQTVDLGSYSSTSIALAGSDTFTITSGTIKLYANTSGGARLQFNGDVNWTGGVIQLIANGSSNPGGQTIILHGLTNTIGSGVVYQTVSSSGVVSTKTTFAPLTMSITTSTLTGTQTLTQTLTTGVALGDVSLREFDTKTASTYTHTISSTASSTSGNIGKVTIQSAGATDIFQLGSDLVTSNTTTSFITAAGGLAAGSYFVIDLNGHTFDGTASANGWQPNDIGSSVGTKWQITSSAQGGTLKAKSFNLGMTGATSSDSLSIGTNVTLEATGGNGTANILSVSTGATYSIDSGSVFLYSGSAAASNAATLVSSVAIGALQVKNGALQLAQSAFNTQGSVAISAGGTLDLDGSSACTLTLASNQNFSVSNGSLEVSLGDTSVLDAVEGSGTGTFSLVNSTLVLSLGSGFSYTSQYEIFSGFSSGTIEDLTITGYDSTNYIANLSSDGVLSFTVVPEPKSLIFVALGGLLVLRKWNRCRPMC